MIVVDNVFRPVYLDFNNCHSVDPSVMLGFIIVYFCYFNGDFFHLSLCTSLALLTMPPFNCES